MALCGGGGCQSSCRRPEEDDGAAEEARERLDSLHVAGERSSIAGTGDRARCSKCGEEGRYCNSLCAACFRVSVYNKFKLAVTSNAMISPTDNILVAFSGGHASRVALQFVHEMQGKSLKNWDASKSQALPVFGVGVAFIDESIFSHNPSDETEKAIEEIRSVVSNLTPPHKELHIIPIENICSLSSENGRSRLNELLEMITDATGKDDFLHSLRMLSLQKIAFDKGYSKILLGSCTSTIARHVLSATVKGQGYSLPADVQYVEARREVPVVLPLRDCLAQELSMLCRLDGFKTQQLLERPCTGINSLVSSFVARLQEENPSRERTIVRTVEKLRPFGFNKFSENGYHDFLPSRLRCKFQNVKNGESSLSDVLCPICEGPLSESEIQCLESIQSKAGRKVEIFAAQCCKSCNFQILPKGAASLEHFYSVLPQLMTQRMKDSLGFDRSQQREQIEDFLLADDDDGT
ncbi:cytoplasmic tRNA 2-thiolation protein 2 [Phoenix dactylifera]|uniref:Cytoplasmic tRNA 2-thiolation protein 2 n=1 Tax=Phoenix dactylifera TaxID=42345 RepID=A0A8B7C6H5_PHODC|nr:cytoplasmic tRNA 2-thiolation protein 2 [Phoenix dactylifera]